MPYSDDEKLPDAVKELPDEARKVWREAFNNNFEKQKDDEAAMKAAWGAVKNAGWIKEENGWIKKDIGVNKNKTYNIDDKEIFAIGRWNNVTVTERDLEEIEKNFYILKDQLKPPLKLGHRDNLNAKAKDGEPAIGWVSELKKAGGKLLASFKNVPEIVYKAITGGGYRTVSSEIFKNYTNNGKSYGKVLAGVALVGADLPAVTTLQDLSNYYTDQSIDIIEFTTEEGNIMEIADLQKRHDEELSLARAAQTQADIAVKKLEAENKRLSNMLALQEFTKKLDTFKVFCEEKVKEGKLAPVSRDKMLNLINKKEYTDGNSEIYFSLDDIKEIIENSISALSAGEMGEGSGNGSKMTYTDAGAEVERLTKEYATKNNVDYATALNAVLTSNTQLADEYINDVKIGEEIK